MHGPASTHRLGLLVVAGAVATGGIGWGGTRAAHAGRSETAPPVASDTLPECPRQWERLPKQLGGRLSSADGFPVSGTITDVPEFHDCQRLIVDSHGTYGPLVAVFAAYDLENLPRRSDSASAGALILDLSLNRNYDPLHIRTGFSCLYLWTQAAAADTLRPIWRARILNVGRQAEKCLTRIDPSLNLGTELPVRIQYPGIEFEHDNDPVPPVARWQWDARTNRYYIGIKCGRAWCEVGAVGSTPAPSYARAAGASHAEAIVRTFKGWYDEQPLAAAGNSSAMLDLTGTVFPAPGPEKFRVDSTGKWDTVAYLNISRADVHYKKMLNVDPVPATLPFARMNVLELCSGTRAQCVIPFDPSATVIPPKCGKHLGPNESIIWARITAAGDHSRMYRCVKRYDHSMEVGKPIPNAARWRWVLDDETVWKECVQGCCEVESET